MPNGNMDETMTQEEFYEWLQNAAQAGMFDNAAKPVALVLVVARRTKRGRSNGEH